MDNHERVMLRFAKAFRQALIMHFKTMPSTSVIADGFNQHAEGEKTITRETARKWLNGLAYPEAGRLQVLLNWLNLNPVDILVSSQYQRTVQASKRKNQTTESGAIHFAQHALDALTAHVAILDKNGLIVQVNQAWKNFTNFNSPPGLPFSEKVFNYLEVCDQVKGADRKTARAMSAGIRAVLRGEQADFALKYPCHSADKKGWYVARTTRFIAEGQPYAVVSHEAVSEKNWLELTFP